MFFYLVMFGFWFLELGFLVIRVFYRYPGHACLYPILSALFQLRPALIIFTADIQHSKQYHNTCDTCD